MAKVKVAEHLVHESEFRGESVVTNRAAKRLVFCGAGALGSKLLNLLVSQGYQNILVVDKDRVEQGNFGTQDYGLMDIGRMKAAQCKINIFKRFKIGIEAVDAELTTGNIRKTLRGADLVLDLFDNAPSRSMVKVFCGEEKIECLHVGMSDDGFAEIEWNKDYTCRPAPIENNEAPCDYPLASNLVALTVGLAAEVINRYIDTGVKKSVHFTIKDLHVHQL